MAIWAARGSGIVGTLLRPSILAGFLVLDLALLAYRLAAIGDAFRQARLRWPSRGRASGAASLAILVALLGMNVGVHAYAANVDLALADLETTLLAGQDPGDEILPSPSPEPSLSPTGRPPGSVDTSGGYWTEPTPPPTPRPHWMWNDRLDVLLIGGDAGPGRWGLRTDSVILVSVDIPSGRAAMFGFPRNLVNVPLPPESADAFPDCHCYPDLLNSLVTGPATSRSTSRPAGST